MSRHREVAEKLFKAQLVDSPDERYLVALSRARIEKILSSEYGEEDDPIYHFDCPDCGEGGMYLFGMGGDVKCYNCGVDYHTDGEDHPELDGNPKEYWLTDKIVRTHLPEDKAKDGRCIEGEIHSTDKEGTCFKCGKNIKDWLSACTPQKQEAPLSAIEWIKKEGWDLRGIKSVKFMHKYSVDKEITPLELMHQYAHRIDPDKLAEEIYDILQNTPVGELDSISQTIKEHLNR